MFASFFRVTPAVRAGTPVRVTVSGELERQVELALASADERLREKSFAECTPEELEALAALMARRRIATPLRRTRRLAAARRGSPDLRRTLRRSLRTGGEPIERAWRARRVRERRVVLLLDVSGSMSDWSRALVLFAHAAVRSNRSWEAFCFGTRLTRLTRALSAPGADEALRRAAEAAPDRDGGTRIGESLKAFLDDHGRRGLARGAVVVIASDGLETGDPGVLARAGRPPLAARPPRRLAQPAEGRSGLRAARRAACARRCRTSTSSRRPQPREPGSARRAACGLSGRGGTRTSTSGRPTSGGRARASSSA